MLVTVMTDSKLIEMEMTEAERDALVDRWHTAWLQENPRILTIRPKSGGMLTILSGNIQGILSEDDNHATEPVDSSANVV